MTTREGSYLAAGARQFGGFWTRDFCFAVRGLLSIGRDDVARNHLTHLLRTRRTGDDVIARLLDFAPSARRVLVHTALRFLPPPLKRISQTAPLRAEHVGEHKTIAIDSNALVIRAVADLHRKAPDSKWLETNRAALQAVLDFCLVRTNGATELATQGRFEDWQDTVAREGKTLFVNAMFAVAFENAKELGLRVPKEADAFGQLIERTFWDESSSIFRSHTELPVVSLDGNVLMIIERELQAGAHAGPKFYQTLKKHPIWSKAGIPGAASDPDYPSDWISWTAKTVGLRHYHDRLLWAWLSALSAKAAWVSGDHEEADRIFSKLQTMAERDGAVAEVYDNSAGLPLTKTWLYESEMPFSWGSGCVLEALDARTERA
ncbi:MAG: hypothetical protein V4760_10895 [Bdellovibrionota bacterium]